MTDSAPFRLRLATAITDGIKASVTPGNGSRFDLSDFDPGDGVMAARVFRGRQWFGDNDPIPMVSLLEGVNPAEETSVFPIDAAAGEYEWALLVQGFVADDPAHPTDPAYWLERDVRRAVKAMTTMRKNGGRSPDPFGISTWGLPSGFGVMQATVGIGVVRPADDISAKAYFWFPLRIRIVEAA